MPPEGPAVKRVSFITNSLWAIILLLAALCALSACSKKQEEQRSVDQLAKVVEFRQSTSVRDDPAVQGNLPPSYVVERPPEAPAAQKQGGAFALLEFVQFAPLAEVQLAPGATHEVELQVPARSLLMGSAKWIGTPDLLGLSVSIDGSILANGTGFPSGPDRGGSILTVGTEGSGVARLSVTNTSAATVSVRIVFGALSLDLLE
jgi:hypothetical protein